MPLLLPVLPLLLLLLPQQQQKEAAVLEKFDAKRSVVATVTTKT